MATAFMTQVDLLTRLEQATEGSRELDEAIALELGWEKSGRDRSLVTGEPMPWVDTWEEPGSKSVDLAPPSFSSSLDAALTLVPEGLLWLVGVTGLADGYKPFRADVWGKNLKASDCIGLAATPALALCIAALRAQHAKAVRNEKE